MSYTLAEKTPLNAPIVVDFNAPEDTFLQKAATDSPLSLRASMTICQNCCRSVLSAFCSLLMIASKNNHEQIIHFLRNPRKMHLAETLRFRPPSATLFIWRLQHERPSPHFSADVYSLPASLMINSFL